MSDVKYAYWVAIVSMLIILLFGIAATVTFLIALFKQVTFSSVLFTIVSLYFVYHPLKIVLKLRDAELFHTKAKPFLKKHKKLLQIVAAVACVLGILFLSGTYATLNFYLKIALYLPVFVLGNIAFIVVVFLKQLQLAALQYIVYAALAIIEVLYLFVIARVITKFLKRKTEKAS